MRIRAYLMVAAIGILAVSAVRLAEGEVSDPPSQVDRDFLHHPLHVDPPGVRERAKPASRERVKTGHLEDWGKLVGDVPAATAILDRFLHHAEIITINGKSYRLRNSAQSPGFDPLFGGRF